MHDADRSPQGRGSSHVQEKKNNQLAFKTSQPHPTTTGGSVTLAAETKMLQNQNILVKSPKKFGAGAKKYQSQGVLAKFKKNANKFWAAVDPFWSPPGGVQSQNQSVTPETPVSHHRGGGSISCNGTMGSVFDDIADKQHPPPQSAQGGPQTDSH